MGRQLPSGANAGGSGGSGGTPDDNSVTSAKIVDGAIVNADINAAAAIAASKLDGTLAPKASPTFTGVVSAPEFDSSGLTGATAASRYVGATTSGAPASGTFVIGDYVIDRGGAVWVCTTAGSPGTWKRIPDIANQVNRALNTAHDFTEAYDPLIITPTGVATVATVAYVALIPCYPGQSIASLSLYSRTTALTMGSNADGHAWAALYPTTLDSLLGQSTDAPALTWGAAAAKVFTLTAAYPVPAGVFAVYGAVHINIGTGGSPAQVAIGSSPSLGSNLTDSTTWTSGTLKRGGSATITSSATAPSSLTLSAGQVPWMRASS